MTQPSLFDARESERLKRQGMRQAAKARRALLLDARRLAIAVAKKNDGLCTSDTLGQAAQVVWGIDLAGELGNAMGSMFKTDDWEFTGERVKSTRVKRHAGEVKVWRLTGYGCAYD
jgi:hypothetical protein